jgi:hypothetical protein
LRFAKESSSEGQWRRKEPQDHGQGRFRDRVPESFGESESTGDTGLFIHRALGSGMTPGKGSWNILAAKLSQPGRDFPNTSLDLKNG